MKEIIEQGDWKKLRERGRLFGRARARMALSLKRLERRADARFAASKPKTVRVRHINRGGAL